MSCEDLRELGEKYNVACMKEVCGLLDEGDLEKALGLCLLHSEDIQAHLELSNAVATLFEQYANKEEVKAKEESASVFLTFVHPETREKMETDQFEPDIEYVTDRHGNEVPQPIFMVEVEGKRLKLTQDDLVR